MIGSECFHLKKALDALEAQLKWKHSEPIRSNMRDYEKHENYKFKALRGKIEKSARVKGPIILILIAIF